MNLFTREQSKRAALELNVESQVYPMLSNCREISWLVRQTDVNSSDLRAKEVKEGRIRTYVYAIVCIIFLREEF